MLIFTDIYHVKKSAPGMVKYGNNFWYYTLYSLSVFSLAKSLQLILEISAT